MPDKQKNSSGGAFDEFVGKYALSKTLRFELKPVPRTRQLLELDKNNIFPKDKYRAENYAIIKKYIDKLHAKFINAALALPEAYIDIKDSLKVTESEAEDESVDEEQSVESDDGEEKGAKSKDHKKVIDLFNQLSKADKIGDKPDEFNGWVRVEKNKVSGKLFNKELIDILRIEFSDELEADINVPVLFFNKDEKGKKRKLKEVFNSFGALGKGKDKEGQNFTTYFSSAFHDNRRNYYKADGKAGRVATRIADENLTRFCTNLEKFGVIQSKLPKLLNKFNQGWTEYFKEKGMAEEGWVKQFDESKWQDEVFGIKYRHFLQADINRYNFITRKLNKDINESGVQSDNFQKLHKQVHGEVKKQDEEFEVDKDNIFSPTDSFIKKFITHSRLKLEFSREIFFQFLNEKFLDPKNVFLSSRAITTISNKCFVSWHTFGGKILEYLNNGKPEKKQRKKLPDFVDLQTVKNVLDAGKDVLLLDMFKYRYFEVIDPNDEQRKNEREELEVLRQKLCEGEHWKNFLRIVKFEFESLVVIHNETAQKLLAETVYKKGNKDFSKSEQDKQVDILFDFAESANGILNMTKYFALRKKGVMVEKKEYANRDEIHEQVEAYLDGDNEQQERCLINGYYKALKHFITKKPWTEDKVVLNFNNAQFLQGWPQSQEKVKCGVILKKKQNDRDLYYLVVLEDKNYFENKDLYKDIKSSAWQKMVYTQLQNPSRMLPKIFITPFLVASGDNKAEEKWEGIDRGQSGAKDKIKIGIQPTDEILNGYIQGKHKKQKKINPDPKFLQKYFDFLKDAIRKYYDKEFSFPDTKGFLDTSLFYAWVEENVYDIQTVNISDNTINDLVVNPKNKKQVYLFQIYNKDFEIDEEIGRAKYGHGFLTKAEWRKQAERNEEEKEQGRENLETTFFKLLFDAKNLKNDDGVVYKLSGGAKMFYRPASESLEKKKVKDKDGQEKEVFDRQRYKEDKFLLRVPIVINFVNKREGYKINEDVNKLIAQTPFGHDKFRIIALDRGEKNLAYLSVLNEDGKILEMRSLNEIHRFGKDEKPIAEKNQYHDKDGNPVGEAKVEPFKDYHNLLDLREIERLKARKSWERIEKIADLKEGYLGFVVNKIANLVIKAIKEGKVPIVVLENLNVGMKQGRIMIDKQVYSKVEEKIAKKLSYLIDKKLGNFLEAWQLTPEIRTFGGDIESKSQVGIIFYVNPGYTSAICPACGFRKRKYIKTKKAQEEFKKINITFDGMKYKFEYSSEVKGINSGDGIIQDIVYSNVRRVVWDRQANNGKGGVDEIADVTEKITSLFEKFKIEKTTDINKQLQDLNFSIKEEETKFWVQLCKWFHCVQEVRNSVNKRRKFKEDDANGEIEEWGENRDFIFCSHCYFDSEDEREWNELKEKIYIGHDSEQVKFNGDANGAYNIGRKGIMEIEKVIKYYSELDKFKKYWSILRLPKKDEKIPFVKDGNEYVLTMLNDKKKQPYYCVLKFKKESIEAISAERKMRRYPDLLISDSDWDEWLAKNSPAHSQ